MQSCRKQKAKLSTATTSERKPTSATSWGSCCPETVGTAPLFSHHRHNNHKPIEDFMIVVCAACLFICLSIYVIVHLSITFICAPGDYEAAIREHQQELSLSEVLNDVIGRAVASRKIGECYAEMGNIDAALKVSCHFSVHCFCRGRSNRGLCSSPASAPSPGPGPLRPRSR